MQDGLLQCSRYAFGPNRLHYCGPDRNQQLLSHIDEKVADPSLEEMLKEFKTMTPYLRLIADANNIRETFDERVVEAYWIGNGLLDRVRSTTLYKHFRDEPELKKKIGNDALQILGEKAMRGAVPHHSFHVFNVWKRTGNVEEQHTLESMDACRISWGKVKSADGPFITIATEPLVLNNGKLGLGTMIEKNIVRSLGAEHDIESLKPGQIITMHWNIPCEVITKQQALELKRRTIEHILLANQTL